MKLILKLTLFFFGLTAIGFSQNTFFIGSKTYPCSDSFLMKSNKEWNGFDLNVSIIKFEKSGMIALSTQVMDCAVRVSGNILIYLDDGNVITCIDRAKFDCADSKTTTLYSLSIEEINKLRISNINTIRFSLKCIKCLSSTDEGNYTASNKENQDDNPVKEKTDVPILIDKLFNNF